MPRVTIVVPTYNRAHFIREAIDSVLNQTFTDFELIIVDDGSTDNTSEMVHSIDDQRIIYLKQQNKGPAAARNTGIKAASGSFVAFLDSDDLFLPEKLSLQVEKMENEPEIGLVHGLYYKVPSTGVPAKLAGTCEPELNLRRLLVGPPYRWSTVMLRRSWLDRVGGFDERLRVGEDKELLYRLAFAGCKMVCIAEPLVTVRAQPGSLSKQFHKHEKDMEVLLDKIFSDPRMPPDLLPLKKKSYTKTLLILSSSAYLSSDFEKGHEFLRRAMAKAASLTDENDRGIDYAAQILVNHLIGHATGNPENILLRVISNLPDNELFTARLAHLMRGKFYLRQAFAAHKQGKRGKCRRSAIKAIAVMPSCLRNRGLISLMVRALLGGKFFHTPEQVKPTNQAIDQSFC